MSWIVHHGDCLKILPTLGKVDAVVTDPPYGTGWAKTAFGSAVGEFVADREQPEWDEWSDDWIAAARLIAGGIAFLLPRTRLADAYRVLPKARVAFYIKSNPRPCGPAVEPVLFYGDIRMPGRDIRAYNGDTEAHPCQKPIEVMRWMVRCVDRGSTILDPFCGSGSTGVAALAEGMNFIGIEREAKYVEIARRRIAAEAAQGKLEFT